MIYPSKGSRDTVTAWDRPLSRGTCLLRKDDRVSKQEIAKTLIEQQAVEGANALPGDLSARLMAISGPDEGASFVIQKSPVRIGRGRNNDFVLSDARSSADHAELRWENGEFRIRDIGSTNGTQLNGSQVTEYAVQDGDQIRVGRTTMMLVLEFEGPA